MIELQLLPARDGDCLLLSWGAGALTHRMLIDGGRAGTYPLIKPQLAELGSLDLLVVTHVDQDHILGVLGLLEDPDRPVEIREVWFNGFDQLHGDEVEFFGPRDGERLSTALVAQRVPWNTAFGGRAVRVGRPPVSLGGAALTLLSPDASQLAKLIPFWVAECGREGLLPGRPPRETAPGFEHFGPVDIERLAAESFVPDGSRTNVTSIGFLFEYDGVRLIFTGDGDDARLRESLQPLAEAEGGRLRVDALKVPHHGSKANLSVETLSVLDCSSYLLSTDGSRHGHPDDVAVARILKQPGDVKELAFNYRDRAALWRDPVREQARGYVVRGPERDGHLTLAW